MGGVPLQLLYKHLICSIIIFWNIGHRRWGHCSLFIRKLLLYLLPLFGLFLQQVQVIPSHSVHYEESHPYVPAHEEEEVPPESQPDCSGLHLGLVIFGYSLPGIDFFYIGHGSSSWDISFLDDLAFEIAVADLLLGREDESGIESAENLLECLCEAIHNYI